ncbi:4Fe-4S dicluster domain-containing protein [Bacilliculturomica massiliensis]|uniref:4Fe-4S dicluster domain-containing protein n=1 Tax=Bacilliculturomica massiliensis TaxID=1917867 RepID=UPI00102F80FD|nr:4Fe-4S dicluster domain-containing protein [Bacilliculturomica massiliensis]
MSKKALINIAACKGCGFCVDVCPKQALSLSAEFNPAGYNYAVIDEKACIGCGTCYTVCPDYVYTMVEE